MAARIDERMVLAIWEAGELKHDLDRALVVLAHAMPDYSWEQLRRLSIGQRDLWLMEVRVELFGPRIPIGVRCPHCGERLEFETTADALIPQSPSGKKDGVTVTADGWKLVARLPDSRDLAALDDSLDADLARAFMAERLVISAICNGVAADPADMPDNVVSALSAALVEADPMAEIGFALICPDCAAEWTLGFDIVSYFWHEISGFARDLLEEVHVLATAYGWPESEILALSPIKRRAYIDRIRL